MAAGGPRGKVWVAYGVGVDKVSTEGCDDVADLRDAIKQKFSRKLGEFDASDLIVSYNGLALEEDAPLSTLPGDAGSNKANALVVTVAAPARECPRRAPQYRRGCHSSRCRGARA